MLGWFSELMPLFLVRWLALRRCERLSLVGAGTPVVLARPDVLVRVPAPKQNTLRQKLRAWRERTGFCMDGHDGGM
jgi:hypothetical protein